MRILDYRHPDLNAFEAKTGKIRPVDGAAFRALEALPSFMNDWGKAASATYGDDRIITSTINASRGCQIGDKAFCGQYCFAHHGWNGDDATPQVPDWYRQEAAWLAADGFETSVFLSTDTEPLPDRTCEVTDITRRLLRAMVAQPPKAVILHTHTDVAADPETLPIVKDLSDATNLLVGIGIDTDVEELPDGMPRHVTSVRDRLRALRVLSEHGVQTQASLSPLVGFRDFDGLGRIVRDIGTTRVMLGDLRLDFAKGGTQKAALLREKLGLPAPTQVEGKAYFESLGFHPDQVGFRDQFYVVTPEKTS